MSGTLHFLFKAPEFAIERPANRSTNPNRLGASGHKLLDMHGHTVLAILVAILFVAVLIPVAGFTDTFGTNFQLHADVGGSSDGAAHDTFWNNTTFDIPGISITAVHCHGKVKYDLQVLATGPSKDNPCYAAMGAYGEGSGEGDTWILLPGDKAIYRLSQNYQPWRYCIGDVIQSGGPGAPPFTPVGPPPSPC